MITNVDELFLMIMKRELKRNTEEALWPRPFSKLCIQYFTLIKIYV